MENIWNTGLSQKYIVESPDKSGRTDKSNVMKFSFIIRPITNWTLHLSTFESASYTMNSFLLVRNIG